MLYRGLCVLRSMCKKKRVLTFKFYNQSYSIKQQFNRSFSERDVSTTVSNFIDKQAKWVSKKVSSHLRSTWKQKCWNRTSPVPVPSHGFSKYCQRGDLNIHSSEGFSNYESVPEVIKLFFMLNSAQDEICFTYKIINTSNLNFLSVQQNWAWNFSC